jgi:hypothetical protein
VDLAWPFERSSITLERTAPATASEPLTVLELRQTWLAACLLVVGIPAVIAYNRLTFVARLRVPYGRLLSLMLCSQLGSVRLGRCVPCWVWWSEHNIIRKPW